MDADEDQDQNMEAEELDSLASEYQSWRNKQDDLILLDKIERDSEGTASLHFRIDYQSFTLRCPPKYPHYEQSDDNFFVEASSCLQLWCNALNEFLLDSGARLTLACILSKGSSLYSSKDKAEMMDYDDNSDKECEEEEEEDDDDDEEKENGQDYHLDDMLDQDLNWELEVSRRRKKWRQKEEELRMEKAENADSSSSSRKLYQGPDTGKVRQPKQIFSTNAASGILTNDLVKIMETAKETGIVADTILDNIFQWNVKMSEFGPESPLDKDCRELKEKFGYDYIELQLDFSMDLYPFYPPLVKVIRPRLQGSMMLRVTTMDILRLTNGWDPAKDMKSVLIVIKQFLAHRARLNVQSVRNNRLLAGGAYIPIEHSLLRLALVSDVTPRANKEYSPVETPRPVSLPSSALASPGDDNTIQIHDSSDDDEDDDRVVHIHDSSDSSEGVLSPPLEMPSASGLAQSSICPKKKESLLKKFFVKRSEDKGKVKKGFAKGTGYSTYSQPGWDVNSFMAAQRENDRQIHVVLQIILRQLRMLHGLNPDGLDSVEDVETEEEERGGKRKRKHSPSSQTPADSKSYLYTVLEGSALMPFLESRLQSSSFLEICRHTDVYRVIIGILREMCEQSCLVRLLGPLPNQDQSLHSLLQSLETQARIANDKIGKASANGSVPSRSKKTEEGSKDDGQMAKDFLVLSKDVTEALKTAGYLPDVNGSSRTETPSPESPQAGPSAGPSSAGIDEDERYRLLLLPLQYEGMEFASHSYQSEISCPPDSRTIRRIAYEIATISNAESLPCSKSSSIFVRSDDSKIVLLKAVITGPTDTPYTGGIFEFDILFPVKPPGYPSAPPKVMFRTTGAGSVRFNPNLYNDGKVCLSLLGTWDGAPGEQWSPDNSTIIQVLISIQSLILVPEPYYNEPGYDKSYGTSSGNRESQNYNENVFKNNLKHAILEQIRSPPEGFESVVRNHFFCKRDSLIKELEMQAANYSSKDIGKLLSEVKTELLQIKIN